MDHVVRKKANLFICGILIMTTFYGCNIVNNYNNFVNRKREIETSSRQIIEYIVNENKTNLLNFFQLIYKTITLNKSTSNLTELLIL